MTSYHRVPSSAIDPSTSSSPAVSPSDLNHSHGSSSHHHHHHHPNGASNLAHPTSSSALTTTAHSGTGTASAHSRATSNNSSSNSNCSGGSLRRTWSERWNDKGMAVLWVGSAILVAHFSHFASVVVPFQSGPSTDVPSFPNNSTGTSSVSDPKVPVRWLMQLAGLLILGVVLSWLYLVLYLPYVKGLTDPSAWPVYCPKVIPGMILTALLAFIVLVRACWPVWGCLSPLVWSVEIVGALFATHLVPWWPC